MVTRSSVWMVRILVLLALAVAWVLLLMPSDLPASDVWRTALLLVRSGLLLVIPGLAVVLVLRPVHGADMLQTISLAPVVTLSLVPVLLLWTSVWGWRWGLTAVRGAILVGALVVAWKMGSVRATRLGRNVVYGALALGMVFLVALGVRLWVIRGVPYPAGGDSYHHTLITQLIIDGGRVPEGYHPYAPYDGFHYHFGYHAVSAALGWATGLPAHRAVLWGAQVLNALTVPSLFYFVDRVTRDRRAAVIAAAMAAVVCRLPAYYVNWGRYPQMAGQLILPPAVAVTWEVTHRQRGWWRTALLGALLAAGLGLTHYRIAIYYLAALVVLGGALLVVERLRAQRLGRRFLALGLLGGVALGTLAPWLPSLLDKTVSAAQEVAARGEIGQYDYLTLDFVLEMGLSRPVLIVASVAGLWLLLRARRRPLGVLILVWLGLVIFLANPSVSRILPSGFFNNGTVVLSLFLPASLLVGVAAGDILGLLADALLWQGSLAIGLVAMLAIGANRMADEGYTGWCALILPGDPPALDWVAENTPADATFLAGFDFWLEEGLSGNDGGCWIPYATGRRTTVLPMIYIDEATPEQIAATNTFARQVLEARTGEELAAVLRAAGVGYAYRSGRREQPWHPLLDDPAQFECLYDAQGVRIYRVR